ncbi:MAG TPA: alanine--tRNA ligase, partial [Chloroflexota bacterium]
MQGAPTNKPVTSEEIRRAWLDFFKGKGHLEMPSSSLVPHDDPTVLLTTAGMQQMIPFMLGREQPPRRRLVSIQKCFRTTDIDSVGNLRNLTFFEMLGNFSIGDYFKAEAIAWAWEFVLDWLKLPADRLWITVHPTDDEAVDLWLRTGVPRERIVPLEENWWGPPGLSGPCGPDSELYLDRGEALGCGRPDCKPGCDCERFLEFWNLVFMQYYQDEHGHRTPLAQKNIDTGAGLERLSAIMQECRSVYETDLFRPIVAGVERLTGLTYGASPEQDFGLRVLADHGRGMTFLVGDGVVPSNEGRGYVLRRIVRRAVRYGRLLGLDRPFLTHIVDLVIDRMGKVYPSLIADRERIRQTVATEEERFAATLQAGLALLERWTAEARDRGERSLSGELVFKLYDTYGFPKELTAEILRERGLTFDEDEYRRAMEEQRARSRAAGRFAVAGRALGTTLDVPRTEFLGYEATSAEGRVLALQRDGVPVEAMGEGETGVVVLDRTPFYAEAGGQVGDTGVLVGPAGRFLVEDTQSDGAGHHLHLGRVVEGVLQLGETVQATVDARRREDIMRHHTVTHLLHQALQDVLGPHALQAGSLVSPDVARFDFAHPRPVSPEELERVAEIVNQKILADAPVTATWMSLEEARSLGAKMLFGEKYGERVRVVSIDGYSRELCGGT